MARHTCVIPHSYLEEMEELTDEEFGRLMRSLLRYSIDGTQMKADGSERYFFKRVQKLEDSNIDAYEAKCEKLKSNAKKKAYEVKQIKFEEKQIDIDEEQIDIDKEQIVEKNLDIDGKGKDKGKGKDNNNSTPPLPPTQITDHDDWGNTQNEIKEVWDAWDKLTIRTPIEKANRVDYRDRSILDALATHGKQRILEAIQTIQASDFLTGKNKTGWKATFDWVFDEKNLNKILEGNYKNSRGVTGKEAGVNSSNAFNRFQQREHDWEQEEAEIFAKSLAMITEDGNGTN